MLENHVNEALEQLNMEAKVKKVEEIQDIIRYVVMSTPALVIDDHVVASGKVLSIGQLTKLLSK